MQQTGATRPANASPLQVSTVIPPIMRRSRSYGHYRAVYPGTNPPGDDAPGAHQAEAVLQTPAARINPTSLRLLAQICSAPSLSRNSHSTLPSTSCKSRIHMSNTAGVIFQLLLKQQNTKACSGSPISCRVGVRGRDRAFGVVHLIAVRQMNDFFGVIRLLIHRQHDRVGDDVVDEVPPVVPGNPDSSPGSAPGERAKMPGLRALVCHAGQWRCRPQDRIEAGRPLRRSLSEHQ